MHFSIVAVAAAFCAPLLSNAAGVPVKDPAFNGIHHGQSYSTVLKPVATGVPHPASPTPPANCQPGHFCTVTVPAAPEAPALANPIPSKPAMTPGQTKRDNPVYFNLECGGENMSAYPRKCNNKPLDGNWCAKNCKCTWTGCIECGKFDGCSAAVVSATCAAAGINGWGCDCVGFGPKEGQSYKCAS